MPELDKETVIEPKKNHKKPRFWVAVIIGSLLAAVLLIFVSFVVWYQQSLQPLSSSSKQNIRFEVKAGQGSTEIATNLKEARLIKDANAMVLYIKLINKPVSLQAGTYVLSPSHSVQEIVSHLEEGKTDLLKVTIVPGRTLADIKNDLKKQGYSSEEVDAAFNATYESPLLADKPESADLEGYIFPETFEVNAGDNLQKLLQRSFDTLYARLQKDGTIDAFRAKGLNIHQALTLASIIQKEASDPKDQPQIAQVFFTRIQTGMKLESDVTFHYAAEKMGVAPRVNLESPYNTRLVAGLPPTPISNMNYSALQAVAKPASGDYVYFIAGDDGKIYYAHTFDQHQENIAKHCSVLCGNAF